MTWASWFFTLGLAVLIVGALVHWSTEKEKEDEWDYL